ncbi:MAG TPA: hypothetical protein VGI98_07240 [Candidatus Limnocylindrales bacterium]
MRRHIPGVRAFVTASILALASLVLAASAVLADGGNVYIPH